MQYQGWVSIAGVKTAVTSSSLDKKMAPIIGDPLIWGGGYPINYSRGKNTYEGDIAFPLFDAFVGTMKTIVGVGAGNRDTFFQTVVNDAVNQYTYASCKATRATISSGGDGNVQLSLGLAALGRTSAAAVAGSGFTGTTVANNRVAPLPYFASQFTAFGIPSASILSWSLTINNNPFTLWTHDGTADPNDIQLGSQNVEGSFSYYATGQSGFGWLSGAVGTTKEDTGALIDVDGGTGSLSLNGSTVWTMGPCVLSEAPRPLDNVNNKPVRNVRFRILGTAANPPLY